MSRAMASLPWRRPWRPRTSARKETANTPSPKRDSRCNQDEGWREVWRSYGRDGGGGGATQCTQDDGGTARRCGSSAAALWAKEEAGKCEMRALGVAGGCWRDEGALRRVVA